MGSSQMRVVVVSKRTSSLLLVLVTTAIAGLLWFLSGKTYAIDAHPYLDLIEHPLSTDVVLITFMPAVANILVFIPWGFLTFIVLDTASRPRSRTYVVTVLGGFLFATLMHLAQFLLPTKVLAFSDTLANAIGALTGATLAHLRKQVRIRFET